MRQGGILSLSLFYGCIKLLPTKYDIWLFSDEFLKFALKMIVQKHFYLVRWQ